jgi:hypothetical protein
LRTLDVDASEIGKVKNVDWAHVSDAKRGLQQLMKAGDALGFKRDFSEWHRHVIELRAKHALNYNRESSRIQAEYVLEQMNEITRGNAIVATGVGQHQMWAAQYLDFINPRTFLTSGSMGTMGFGLPAAIGAQIANPGALVIDVDGDGSIRMNLGELETLTTYDIPVKVLLLNNLGDGMVRQWQDLFYANRYSGSDKTLHKKDFVKACEADGFGFTRASSSRPRCGRSSSSSSRIPAVVPRGHGRSHRARLSDGRSRHGLQGHDHRQVDPGPRVGRREGNRGAGRVLLSTSGCTLAAVAELVETMTDRGAVAMRCSWAFHAARKSLGRSG